MATGIQSKINLTASSGAGTILASGPTSTNAQVLTVSICNTNASAVLIRLAIVATANGTSPASTDYLLYDYYLDANSVIEFGGIVLNNGQTIVARSNTSNVSAVTYGIDDVANSNSGVQGKLDLSSSTWTQVTAGPGSGRIRTISVCFANRGTVPSTIRLAASATPTSPTGTDYLEYGTTLPAGSYFVRSGIVLNNGNGLGAWASTANISCVAYGVDDIAT
jgi:hypothetical protein